MYRVVSIEYKLELCRKTLVTVLMGEDTFIREQESGITQMYDSVCVCVCARARARRILKKKKSTFIQCVST